MVRKSKEDVARLKEIKRNIKQLRLERDTAKTTIKTLKEERAKIKAKYVKPCVATTQ